MDPIQLCRLCLANSVNASMLQTSEDIEQILRKFGILLAKRDLSSKLVSDIITHLCELCWQKIDEFQQFCTIVENVQRAYDETFCKDGTYTVFEDIQQYYLQVDGIHNEFAGQMFKEDKKVFIEPFCIINVDETDKVKATSNGNAAQPTIEDVQVKEEEQPDCDEDESEQMNATDALNTDSVEAAVSEVDLDSEKDDDDYQMDEDEVDASSDSSYQEVKVAPKKSIKNDSPTKAKKKNSKSSSSNEKSRRKKLSRKVTVTSVNVVDEDNKRLLQYVQMKCDVCSDDRTYETFADIQTHFVDAHRQTGYIICCNRKFRRIGRVLQHCTWHENPEAFKCDSCNKCFQDNVCLRDHITSMHIPADERQFRCDQCNRLFAKKHLLNTHQKMKHTVKEERPYVCSESECGQRFVLPAYLRLHVEKVHNHSDSRVCDICARFFKCSKSYERHYQVEHTNIDQRVQCDLCQRWFKHLDTLKDHIRRHYAASETCKYCGRVSSNKKSLRLHIRNVHADIDGSVKTRNEFPCTVCEKIFKKKQTLREHMTLHTGEAYLYTCSFCSKTFRSSANMYAHRKRNHPKEYAEKCVLAKTQKT